MKKYLIYKTPFHEGNIVVTCSTSTYPVTKTESWSEEGFNRALEDDTVQIVKFTSDEFIAKDLNTSGLTPIGADRGDVMYYDAMISMFGKHESVVEYVKRKKPAKVYMGGGYLSLKQFLDGTKRK